MLLAGQSLEETQWTVDGPSECLMPAAGAAGPFRTSLRWNAAVDRLSGAAERHSTACTEFRAGAGLWTVASFVDEAARDRWSDPVRAAFRWLADAGFGGERSRGWGRSDAPEFQDGMLPDLILSGRRPKLAPSGEPDLTAVETARPDEANQEGAGASAGSDGVSGNGQPDPPAESITERSVEPSQPSGAPAGSSIRAHWLLSLFAPSPADSVDWSRGSYTLLSRSGRVAGSGELKKYLQMVCEGSVLYSQEAPRGSAPDVAPDGSPHPVYRAGFAVSIPLPEAA
jgi:hypothetical protein